MAAFRVTCPQCGKKLILKDRSLLGRKGKCPKCEHRFVLTLPPTQEPVIEATQPGPDRVASVSKKPVELPRIVMSSTQTGENYSKRFARRRQGTRRFWMTGGVIFVLLVICVGGILWVQRRSSPPAEEAVHQPPSAQAARKQESALASQSVTDDVLPDREPIQLRMVPSGARLIVNLRPAELWSGDSRLTELRQCLTEDVIRSLSGFLRDVTHREPEQIEEVLLAWILGARGTEPQLAAVVHLVEEEPLSDLIEEFGGEPLDELAQPKVYLYREQAVLIHDRRTIAFAPRDLAWELSDWIEVPNYNTSDGILALLRGTDRSQLLTVVCEPTDVARHVEMLFPLTVRDIARAVTLWFSLQAETVAWSVNLEDEFRSEFLLRGTSTVAASTLKEELALRMESLPSQLMDIIGGLQPSRPGVQKLLKRFPAMLEVSRQATQFSSDGRIVKLLTVLPSKAGPNLALASVLTWAESTTPSHQDESPPSTAAADKSQLTIAERLQLPVDAEFNRTPLQEAIDYIAGEINVRIEIDGDALKDAGYTKNMPQTFDLGRIPARDVLWKILKQYQEDGKQMVLIVNEVEGQATLKTRKFADTAGETPFELTPAASTE